MSREELMTENEWLACTDPVAMLEYLQDKLCNRKLRLFACACSWEEDCWWAQKIGFPPADLRDSWRWAEDWIDRGSPRADVQALPGGVLDKDGPGREWALLRQDSSSAVSHYLSRARAAEQAALFRELFGNPFRPVSVEASWLAATVVQLSWALYNQRQFEGMPVLADALEEAGCTDGNILSHFRGAGPHIRGCWALDLLLGKS
jgi:hypothetical protein